MPTHADIDEDTAEDARDRQYRRPTPRAFRADRLLFYGQNMPLSPAHLLEGHAMLPFDGLVEFSPPPLIFRHAASPGV